MDIDPKAEDIARENAAYNGFTAPDFTALTGNVTGDRKLMEQLSRKRYGLVLVNIVADVIIGLAPVLPEFLGEDTVLICSGILDTRRGCTPGPSEGRPHRHRHSAKGGVALRHCPQRRKSMSMTYRTRRRLQRFGVTALIVLVVLLIAWFCSVIWLQRYVVYSADGAQVDFELGTQALPAWSPHRPRPRAACPSSTTRAPMPLRFPRT